MTVVPFDQSIVETCGSGRLTRGRAYIPVCEDEELRFPGSQDTDRGSQIVDQDVDSAWGARDHMDQSANSNGGQGGGPTDGGSGTQDVTSSDDQGGEYGANLEDSPGEGDSGSDQPETVQELAKVDLRRSTRAGKGKTSWFKDYQGDSRRVDLGSSRSEGVLKVDQLEALQNPADGDLRRSNRAGKGRTSRFKK